jgi:hypothetical protein
VGDVTLAILSHKRYVGDGSVSGILDHAWGLSPAQDRVWAQISGLPPSIAHMRQLMVLQAFIDDSATPGGMFVLAGHVATAEVWAKFSKDWEEMLRYGVLDKYGSYHFKMSEIAANSERMSRVEAFYRIIEQHNLTAISCAVDVRILKKAISRLWALYNRIDWGPFDDPFFFTFRALIDCVHSHREKFIYLPDEKIDFIFDDQSQKKTVLSAWDLFVAGREDAARNRFGATPRFENDKEFLPLQAADLWAWWIREWHEQGTQTVTDEYGNINMVIPLVSSSRPKIFTAVIYSEEKIVESLICLLKSQYPGVTIYDDEYRG